MRQIRYLEQSLAHGFVGFESYGQFYYYGGGGDHCGAGASGPPGVSPLITQHFQSQDSNPRSILQIQDSILQIQPTQLLLYGYNNQDSVAFWDRHQKLGI